MLSKRSFHFAVSIFLDQDQPEDHVLIYGAGTIGLCALSGLIAQGNNNVIVLDIDDSRLEMVRRLGGRGFNPKSGDTRTFFMEQFGEKKPLWGFGDRY